MPPHATTPSSSNSSLPLYHSVLLSISGDSKISLQHTSVQQLSAIPEDRELTDEKNLNDDDDDGGDGTYSPPMIVEDELDNEPCILIQDPAPDGGYGWIIVLASFFCNLIVDGIAYTFGLFFEIFVQHFSTSKSKVALCGSLLNGFYLSVGPLVSSLANRFGCRIVTIAGAIIAFIAFSLSTIAPNIETLYLTYGFLGGVGMGMIFLPAIVSVGYYFTSKRAFATGVAVCGSGVGTFLFAPFCQYLLGVTSWQNTLLILACMILLCAGFGGLMRPLSVHAQAVLAEDIDPQQIQSREMRLPLLQRIAEEKRRRLLAHSNSQFFEMLQNGSLDLNDLTFTALKERLTMNMEPGVHSTLYLDQLFQQNPTPTQQQQQQTPSGISSTNQSQIQLCPDSNKHQLSPIIEQKHFTGSNSNSNENNVVSSGENSSENVTVKENQNEERPEIQEEQPEQQEETNESSLSNEKSPDSEFQSEPTTPESPSALNLPQSPTSESNGRVSAGGGCVGNSLLNQSLRSRRSTMRTVSETSNGPGCGQTDSVSLLPSSTTLMPTGGQGLNGMSASTGGQLPIQVILSTSPTANSNNNNNNNSSKDSGDDRKFSHAIHVRPMSKKDIFYSGSTLHVPSSMQHLASSRTTMGQSIVSIPARDIIAKVQKQIQNQKQEELLENNDDGDGLNNIKNNNNSMILKSQKKNNFFCDKLMRVLCSVKDDCCCCSSPSKRRNNNYDEQTELTDYNNDGEKSIINNKINNNEDGCWQRFIKKLPPSMGSILNEMLDFSLLRESNAFTILAISNIFGMMGFYVPFVYITQYAISSVMDGEKLVSGDQAAFLISIIGITNTVGRLLFGYLSDHLAKTGSICGFRTTALGLNNICVILAGLAVIMAPFCTTYIAVILDCVLFGLFISAYVCLTSVILVDMLGLDKLTNAFGLLCLFRGAASMIGPPLAGALFDMTQSYRITFAAAGLLLIISSIMACFISTGEHTSVDQDPENECDV